MSDETAHVCVGIFRAAIDLTFSQKGAGISDAEILSNPIETFELDSLETMEFIMNIEDRFNVELDEEAVNSCKSLSDLVQLVDAELRV